MSLPFGSLPVPANAKVGDLDNDQFINGWLNKHSDFLFDMQQTTRPVKKRVNRNFANNIMARTVLSNMGEEKRQHMRRDKKYIEAREKELEEEEEKARAERKRSRYYDSEITQRHPKRRKYNTEEEEDEEVEYGLPKDRRDNRRQRNLYRSPSRSPSPRRTHRNDYYNQRHSKSSRKETEYALTKRDRRGNERYSRRGESNLRSLTKERDRNREKERKGRGM